MADSNRLDLIENEDYTLTVEYSEQYFVVHLSRLTPRKSSIESLRDKLVELDTLVKASSWESLYTAIEQENKQMKKLLRLLHTKFLGSAHGYDVYKYEGTN
jgi:hypothetical protein